MIRAYQPIRFDVQLFRQVRTGCTLGATTNHRLNHRLLVLIWSKFVCFCDDEAMADELPFQKWHTNAVRLACQVE